MLSVFLLSLMLVNKDYQYRNECSRHQSAVMDR